MTLFGGLIYDKDELSEMFQYLVQNIGKEIITRGECIFIPQLGDITFSKVDNSWMNAGALGILDFI